MKNSKLILGLGIGLNLINPSCHNNEIAEARVATVSIPSSCPSAPSAAPSPAPSKIKPESFQPSSVREIMEAYAACHASVSGLEAYINTLEDYNHKQHLQPATISCAVNQSIDQVLGQVIEICNKVKKPDLTDYRNVQNVSPEEYELVFEMNQIAYSSVLQYIKVRADLRQSTRRCFKTETDPAPTFKPLY